MEQTICIFGDSITWGAVDPENGGWVAQLRRYFETNDDYNIAKYNSVIEKVSSDHKLPFVNLLDLLEVSNLNDGLHPNSSGHKKIFLKIKEFLLSNKIVH